MQSGRKRARRSKSARPRSSMVLYSPSVASLRRGSLGGGRLPEYKFARCERANLDLYQNVLYTYGSKYFTLDQTYGYADFTALFDQYRIDEIEATFTYSRNSSEQGPSANPDLPIMLITPDFDDVNTVTYDEILQYGTVQTKRLDQPFTIRFKPRLAKGAYAAGVFSSFTSEKPCFIDLSSPSVQHYGLKWVIIQPNPSASGTEKAGTLLAVYRYHFTMATSR